MKTGIIYARVSSEKSVQKETPISSQIEACQKYAKENGIVVLKTFVDEGISGSTDKRPAFQEAVQFAVENRVDYFIVFDTSRFARNIEDAIYYKKLLRKNGVQIAYVTQPLPTDPVAQFLSERIFELFDQYYTVFASTHIKRGMKENARLGYMRGSALPIGYKTVTEGKKKKIVKDESTAYIYFEILKLFKAGYGAKEIAKRLNERGITNRGKSWKYPAVLRHLKNPLFMGVIRHGDEEFYHPHLAYISREEWEWIQEELKRRAGNKGHAKSDLLFIGLLRCKKCGYPMVGESVSKKNGKKYYYYVCQGRKKYNSCDQKRLRADVVDEFLLKRVVEEVFSGERLRQVAEKLTDRLEKTLENYREERNRITKRIADIDRKLSNLLGVIEEGFFTEEVKERIEKLKREKEELKVKLRLLEGLEESLSKEIEIDLAKLREVILSLYQKGEKRAVRRQFAMMIERIEYDGGVFYVKYRKEFLEQVRSEFKLVDITDTIKNLIVEIPFTKAG